MRALLILIASLVAISGFGQAPEGVNYQAIARDGNGQLLANESVDIRFTLRSAQANGPAVYEESHTPQTNDFGLFTLIIGQGVPSLGDFSLVDWGNDTYFLQVEMDAGSGFVDMGTTQLMSVPFALYAKEAGNTIPYTGGTGIQVNGNTIDNTGDTDATDDITNGTAAGGDLQGTYPNPTVAQIQGMPVSAQTPTVGDVLVWNGSTWAPDTVTSQGGGSSVWSTNGSDAYYDQGNVGINNPTPDQALDVEGTLQLSNTGTSYNHSTDNSDESYNISLDGDSINSFYVNKRRYATLFGDNVPVTGLSAFDVNAHTGTNSFGGMYVNHESATGKPFYGYATDGSAKASTYYDPQSETWRVNNQGDALAIDKNGHVGIGTNLPGRELTVNGTTQLRNGIQAFDMEVNNNGQLVFNPNGSNIAALTVDDDNDYVGVHQSNPITAYSSFDVSSPSTGSDYGGMYINTKGDSAKPFYGYSNNGTVKAWTTYNGQNKQFEIHNGLKKLTYTHNGTILSGTDQAKASMLHLSDDYSYFKQYSVLIESTSDQDNRTMLMLRAPKGASPHKTAWMTTLDNIAHAYVKFNGDARFHSIDVFQETMTPEKRTVYGNSLPLAYGSVSSNGSLQFNKYGITSANNINTGVYEISLLNGSLGTPVVNVTPYDANGGEIANYTYDSNTGKITVVITDHNGNKTNSNFSIVIFGYRDHN